MRKIRTYVPFYCIIVEQMDANNRKFNIFFIFRLYFI